MSTPLPGDLNPGSWTRPLLPWTVQSWAWRGWWAGATAAGVESSCRVRWTYPSSRAPEGDRQCPQGRRPQGVAERFLPSRPRAPTSCCRKYSLSPREASARLRRGGPAGWFPQYLVSVQAGPDSQVCCTRSPSSWPCGWVFTGSQLDDKGAETGSTEAGRGGEVGPGSLEACLRGGDSWSQQLRVA